jgi:tRNA G18 (ribose-2'-O)-methylase SpoU
MSLEQVDSLDDPRVAVFRDLKDRELARDGRRFIAEGEFLVRRLLESDYPTEAVLLAQERVAQIAPLAPAGVSVLCAPHEMVSRIVGFKFHSGVLACGRRKAQPTLEQFMTAVRPDGRVTLVICPQTANLENMGALIRIAAALGANGMLLGERCCDPFFRRSIRVPMGSVFRLPLRRATDLKADVREMRRRWGVDIAAAVLDTDAQPLAEARHPGRLGLMFGNEAQGLERQWVELCDRRITIPMAMGTDSLNVAVAAGVILYHFAEGARVTP